MPKLDGFLVLAPARGLKFLDIGIRVSVAIVELAPRAEAAPMRKLRSQHFPIERPASSFFVTGRLRISLAVTQYGSCRESPLRSNSRYASSFHASPAHHARTRLSMAEKSAPINTWPGAALIMLRLMSPVTDSGAPIARTSSRVPPRTALMAAARALVSGFFRFCGWKPRPAPRPVHAALNCKRSHKRASA